MAAYQEPSSSWEKHRLPIVVILIFWLLSSPIILGIQLLLPSEIRLLVNLLWILFQVLLYLIIAVLGGWKIAFLFAYLLVFKLWLPLTMITLFFPLPNPLLVTFMFLNSSLLGVILLSILGWKLAHHFTDPNLIQGLSTVGIMGSSIWLFVLTILWIYLATL